MDEKLLTSINIKPKRRSQEVYKTGISNLRHKAYSSTRWQDQQNRRVVVVQKAGVNPPRVQRYKDWTEPDYFLQLKEKSSNSLILKQTL